MEYQSYPVRNSITVEYFASCFEMTYGKTYSFSGETHDFWEMVYVADGALGITADDRVLELGKGQIIFHKPMEFHRLWSIKGTAPHAVIMSFGTSGDGMDFFQNGIFRLDEKEEAHLWRIIKQAGGIFDGYTLRPNPADDDASQLMRCHLELLLLSIRGHSRTVSLSPRSSSAATYHDMVEYMQLHVSEKLSLSEIAGSCNVSVSTLKNLFRKYAGESPIHYFNRLKLNEAKRLILEGYSMAEVSRALGFSSQNYFSALFKQMTGTTPSAFAASHLE